MKITRYAQSCFLIETGGRRILIDPGSINYDEKLLSDGWADIDAIFVTHKHRDHCHEEAISEILKHEKTVLHSTSEVKKAYPNLNINIVKQGDAVDVGGVKIEVVGAVHGFIPKLRENNIEIKENVGYIIDDGKTRFYHTSDSIGFPNDYKCDVLAIPVNNHGLCFGAPDAVMFAKETDAKTIIPCHYDNPVFPADMNAVKEAFKKESLNLVILDFAKSIEV